MHTSKIFVLLFCFLVFLPRMVLSQRKYTYEPTMEECMYLPDYCRVRTFLRENDKYREVRYYKAKFGPQNWDHMHHYCGARAQVLRGLREKDDYKRKWQFRQALSNFNYVLKRVDKSFILVPDMYVRKGEIYLLLESKNEAVKEYNNALKVRPDYVPAYIGLANCFVALNLVGKAIQILEIGLKHKPNSVRLKRTLQMLKDN